MTITHHPLKIYILKEGRRLTEKHWDVRGNPVEVLSFIKELRKEHKGIVVTVQMCDTLGYPALNTEQDWETFATIHIDQEREKKKETEAMDFVRKHRSQRFMQELEALIEDCDRTFMLRIEDMDDPKLPFQEQETDLTEMDVQELTTHYVHQYENGGITGDSFAGQILVHITGRSYLSFHYSM